MEVTGQVLLDRYAASPGTQVAIGLVNELVVAPTVEPAEAVEMVFAFDPQSVADRPSAHTEELLHLALTLRGVFAALDEGDVATAATVLNHLLAATPPTPHLVYDDESWSLHQHRPGAGLVEAWTSICASSLAALIGDGHHARAHLCAAPDCRRAFVDTTKNGSRRFCSERCQNRTKAAVLRQRRRADAVAVPSA